MGPSSHGAHDEGRMVEVDLSTPGGPVEAASGASGRAHADGDLLGSPLGGQDGGRGGAGWSAGEHHARGGEGAGGEGEGTGAGGAEARGRAGAGGRAAGAAQSPAERQAMRREASAANLLVAKDQLRDVLSRKEKDGKIVKVRGVVAHHVGKYTRMYSCIHAHVRIHTHACNTHVQCAWEDSRARTTAQLLPSAQRPHAPSGRCRTRVQVEERATGQVSKSVYKTYLSAWSPAAYMALPVFVVLLALSERGMQASWPAAPPPAALRAAVRLLPPLHLRGHACSPWL